jgi:hypothetical protein
MTKPAPIRYSEQDAKARFDQALKDALGAPRKPSTMTATLKRRALKKKRVKPDKKTGKGAAIPVVLSFSLRNRNDCSDSELLIGNHRAVAEVGTLCAQSSSLAMRSSGVEFETPNGLGSEFVLEAPQANDEGAIPS